MQQENFTHYLESEIAPTQDRTLEELTRDFREGLLKHIYGIHYH